MIRGWLVRKNCENQENNDGYTKLFDDLDMTQKSALFNVFQGITLYIVPLNPRTRDFCIEMGLDPQQFSSTSDRYQDPFDSLTPKIQEEIKGLEEETHCYAIFC